MKNKSLYVESLGVVILTLLVIFLLYLLSFNVNIFNVLKKSYKKIDLYDLYYSQLKSRDVDISEEIVIVNIANHSRTEIAHILNEVNKYNPKVIGLDVFFKDFNKTTEDSLLLKSLNRIKDKLVLAYDIQSPDVDINKLFQLESVGNGYSNFIGNKEGAPIRKIELLYSYKENIEYSFAYSIIKKFEPGLTITVDESITDNSNPKPYLINYTGGYNRFFPIEGRDLLNSSSTFNNIENKIAIVGYFGSTFNSNSSNEDKHFTPMNKDGGFGIPDMHGSLIHANIVQMMIDKNYIKYWPDGNLLIDIISVFFVFPFVVIFTYFFVRRHLWYHIIAKITQLVLGILLIFMALNLYEFANVKLELKFFLLLLAISVDVLYLYEAMAAFIYKKYGKKSYFIHSH